MNSTTGYVENDFVKLWIEDGILYEYFKVKHVTLVMAKKAVEDRLKLVNGATYPVLIYSNNVSSMDKEAREYFSSEEAIQLLSASAMLVDNYVTLMVSKLFLSFTKPAIDVEIFKSKKKALEWLEKYK